MCWGVWLMGCAKVVGADSKIVFAGRIAATELQGGAVLVCCARTATALQLCQHVDVYFQAFSVCLRAFSDAVRCR